MAHILLIDDDVILLTRLEAQLTETGYTSSKTSELSHGEKLLAEEAIDLVLLDPATAQGQGWATLERIAPIVPVILISGDSLEEDIVRALDLGAVDFLAKPFRTSELLARLRTRLRGRPLQKPTQSSDAESALISTSSIPSTTNPVDRLRRSASEQQEPLRSEQPWPLAERPAEQSRPSTGIPLGERPLEGLRKGNAEEPVFITPDEEHQLFASRQQEHSDELRIDEINRLALGQRLKTARQRRRLTLVQAELDTKIRMSYVQAMEEEKFALLPNGPSAEDMLRSYASYLGLDVESALQEYQQRHFNQPATQLIALGGALTTRQFPRWIISVSAALLAIAIGGGLIWWRDPNIVSTLGNRMQLLISTPTATPLPTLTATLAPTATSAPAPTATTAPSPTSRPTATRTILPTATGVVTTTLTPRP